MIDDSGAKKYKAFISYSHNDEEFGSWLHRELEKYKIPKRLYESYPDLPKSLYPIFRDRYELDAGDILGEEIPKALKNSNALVIICSKSSSNSKWVNKEIIDFKMMHGEDNIIFPIIIDGQPFAKESDKFEESEECFPNALKYKINSDGNLTNERTDILASSSIEKEDGRELAKLKLIAGLLDVPFGEFYRRDLEQKRKDRNRNIAIWGLVFILMAGLTVFSWIQRDRAIMNEEKAKEELNKANYNLGLTLLEKAEKKVKEKDFASVHLFTHLALQKIDNKIDYKSNIARARSIIASNPFYVSCAVSLKNDYQFNSIDITADNKLLVSASDWDGTIQFWDMETQKKLFNFSDGNKTHIQSIDFSPDDKLLAVASSENISLWDMRKKKKIYSFKGHSSTVNCVKFSPDGNILASGSLDKTIKLWDIKSKKELFSFSNNEFSIESLIFIDNKTLISTSSIDIKLWDIEKKELLKTIDSGMDGLENLDISSDRKYFALGGRILKVKDLEKNEIIFQSERDIRNMIESVKFSPDGEILASCSTDSTITLWNVKSRKKIAILKGHTDRVNDIEFSKDGLTLISTSEDKTIRFWDLSNIQGKNFTLKIDKSGTNDIKFSKTGHLFASASYWNNKVTLWDLDTLKEKIILKGHNDKVQKILFSNDEKNIISTANDGTIKIWDIKEQKNITTLVHHANKKAIKKISSLDDLNKIQQTWMSDIIFGKDENMLFSAGWDKVIKIWDLRDNQLAYSLPEFQSPITSLILSKKESSLIFSSISNYIVIRKLDKDEEPLFLENNCYTHTLSLSHDEKILASGMEDGTIIFWDLKTKKKKTTLNGHLSSSIDLSFTPNDKYLATASDDGIVIIWDIENQKEWARIEGYTDNSINCVSFSPNGKQLVAGLGEGNIYFWDMTQLNNITNTSFQNKELERLKQQLSIQAIDTQKINNNSIIFGWSKFHPNYWLTKAKNGDKDAMYQLGLIYDRNNQTTEALKWYQKALHLGNQTVNEKIQLLNKRAENERVEKFQKLLQQIIQDKKHNQ
jgi:WD40 repeat protein